MAELVALAAVLTLLDQFSKQLVLVRVADRAIACGSLVRIRTVISRKRIYTDRASRSMLVMIWCAALASAIVLARLGWFQNPAARFGLASAFGGATGNLLDVLRRRSVVDFIDLGWWPLFNIADVAIVGGLVLAFWQA